MEELKKTLKKLNIFDCFLILSPLLDLITSQMSYKGESNFTLGMIVRFSFLMIMIAYLIFKNKSKYKKKSIIYITVLILFGIINLINSYVLKGSTVMMGEIKYMIKSFYFPLMLIISLNYFDDKKINSKETIFYLVAMAYVFLILLAYLIVKPFGYNLIGKKTYSGWFFAANEVGGLLGLLAPFIIFKTIKYYKKWYFYVLLIIYVFVALIIATSAPTLGIFLSTIVYIIAYILKFIFNKSIKIQKAKIMSFIIVIFIVITFLGSFVVRSYPMKQKTKEERIHIIFNFREKHNDVVFNKYKEANIKEKIIGLGYIDADGKEGRPTNNIETDFGDIFYPYGILGFIIYYCSFCIIIISIMKMSIINFNKIINNSELEPYFISICLMLGLGFFAGHIFLAPAVSIYPAIILSALHRKLKIYNTPDTIK